MPSGVDGKRRADGQLVTQLEEQPLGDLLADARDGRERREIARRDGARELR